MKKREKILLILLFITLFINKASAFNFHYEPKYPLRLREKATTNSKTLTTMPQGAYLTPLSEPIYTNNNDGCSNNRWVKVKYNNLTGYICLEDTNKINTNPNQQIFEPIINNNDFEANLRTFPADYQALLRELHNKHPNWIFKRADTRYTFDEALNHQMNEGVSSISNLNRSRDGLLRTDSGDFDLYTNTFKSVESGVWFFPSRETVAYLMDPRNFLNEVDIFMFVNNNHYDPNLLPAVDTMMTGTNNKYNEDIKLAIRDTKINPVFAVSRIIQEVGRDIIKQTSGTYTFSCGNQHNISGYYNFFNIGAYNGANSGLCHAYNKGWNTPYKALIGGINKISSLYIKAGSETFYFQKFDVHSTGQTNWGHFFQYMTNVEAPQSEANIAYKAYKDTGFLEANLEFLIPVYKGGLPNKTTMPNPNNPNNFITDIKINGNTITGFNPHVIDYTVKVDDSIDTIRVAATPAYNKTRLDYPKEVKANGNQTITVNATSLNNVTRSYKIHIIQNNVYKPDNPKPPTPNNPKPNTPTEKEAINIKQFVENNGFILDGSMLKNIGYLKEVREINNLSNNEIVVTVLHGNGTKKTEGVVATGNKINFDNGVDTKNYIAIIKGDIDGNGYIDNIDLAYMQRALLNDIKFNNIMLKAGDINNNKKIDNIDLVYFQRQLLNDGRIPQK